MKILLDECVPRPIARFLSDHTVSTVQEMSWGAFKNGALLNLADSSFDLFLTSDQNLRYQQNLSGRRIAILELSTNNWSVIKANAGLISQAVAAIQPGEFVALDLPTFE